MPGPEDLVAHVRRRHVVVIGAGAAGLVAAWECARIGLSVTVVDAADRLGGSLAPTDVEGREVEGAHADIAAGDPTVDEVLALLGCTDTVSVPPGEITLAGHGAAPADGLLGIPANPWAPDVRRVIGWSGTWRAYLDRLRPPLTIGREPSLGVLVRRRLGARVADRLVAPIAAARWESAPEDLDADAVLPGISTALTRTGSLAGAVALLQGERAPERRVLRGGFGSLVAALDTHLRDLGADLRTSARVSEIAPTGDRWQVTVAADSADADAVVADAVIVATGPVAARNLLAPILADAAPIAITDEVDVLTLVADVRPGGAAGTRRFTAFAPGSGVFSVTETTEPTETTEAPEKTQARRIFRVVLPATDRDDAALTEVAVAALADLLDPEDGPRPDPRDLRVASRVRRVAAGTGRRVGDEARMAATRATIEGRSGLFAVGAWLAGGDLADEIGDAARTAERVRHSALWGAEAARDTP